MRMADDLLFVYSSPGAVDPAEFTDWYDNEHIPARVATPGFGRISRFRAADRGKPEWLATYDIKPGTLETPAYKALGENASEREKRIMSSVATLDRRVYRLVSSAGGITTGTLGAPVLMVVSMSMPDEAVPDMEAYYRQEHHPMIMAVPGWRRSRRFVLTSGTGPKYLSLHEIESPSALKEPALDAALSTSWHTRIVAAATFYEQRIFSLHKSFG